MPRFTSESALDVIKSLAPVPDDEPRKLAKRLRRELAARGVHMKHANSLQAASRLLGHESWHASRRTVPTPTLRLTSPSEPGEQLFSSWKELAPQLCKWCAVALQESKSKIIRIRLETLAMTLNIPLTATSGVGERPMLLPLLVVTPVDSAAEWLDGSASALEHLRRYLEESKRAILDGVAVLQLCRGSMAPWQAPWPQPVRPADACNSELVLLREDNELDPGSGFEIARGDELICWSQLELAAEDHRNQEITIDGGAWRISDARYVWQLSTLHPKDYVPGLVISALGVRESRKLLRRYRFAKRIFPGRLANDETTKSLEYLGAPDDCYRIDLHRLLHALQNAGLTWESYCAEVGSTQTMEPKLPFGFMLSLLERLNLPDPNVVWARPTHAETMRVDDDGLLRALMPRVHHVTYRLPHGLDGGLKSQAETAIAEFSTSMHLQKQIATGAITMKEPLPYLVYAGDGEELRLKLQECDLRMRVGVIPRLFKTEGLIAKINGAVPFAFGYSLYLDIHFRQDGKT